jgi:DNA-binding MarR family transcriptional regulator
VSGDRRDALDTSLLFDVFALNQAVGQFLARAMRTGPLTPGEYAVYSAMFELESATPTALAGRLGMRLTTFMDQLHVIEERGHARRLPNPRDRRSHLVTLTATGLEAHRAANRLFEAAYDRFSAALGVDEGPSRRALRRVRAAAEEAALCVDPPPTLGEVRRVTRAISPRPRGGPGG